LGALITILECDEHNSKANLDGSCPVTLILKSFEISQYMPSDPD
jgi:hypothetical protein